MTAATTALSAQSGSASIDPKANLSYAGTNAGTGDGVSPVGIALTAGTNRVLQLLVTGSWTCDTSINGYFSADGFNSGGGICVGPANVGGSGGISGLVTPGRSMTLSAVFLGAAPPASAPANYDYSGPLALNQLSYSGIVNGQIFFVGDGRSSDITEGNSSSGMIQSFLVPDDAMFMYFGVADACGFSGAPSCYSDNGGDMTVDYTVATASVVAPEPSTYALMGVGLLAIGVAARRRRA